MSRDLRTRKLSLHNRSLNFKDTFFQPTPHKNFTQLKEIFKDFVQETRPSDNQALTNMQFSFREHKAQSLKKPELNVRISKTSSVREEKKIRGSLVDIRVMEMWLNKMLMEACFTEKFQENINNAALKKFGIDRNTLRSKGISDLNIDRLYRSLYVYSMGFNSLLEQICHHMWKQDSMNTKMTIWKVFSSLLQYCSRGQFDTMIGQLQRQKNRKMNSLKAQIENRENVILQLQNNFKQKNQKVLNQIRVLSLQKEALFIEKNILEEDFRQTDQAFNQEVAIRLKFQHKINQIHGVHRQLSIKHQRLYTDFQALKQILEGREEQLKKTKGELLAKIADIGTLSERLEIKSEQIKLQFKQMEQLKNQLRIVNERNQSATRNFEQANQRSKQEERVVESLKFQMQNSSKTVELLKQLNSKLQLKMTEISEDNFKSKEELIQMRQKNANLKAQIFEKEQSSLTYQTKISFLQTRLKETLDKLNSSLDQNSELQENHLKLKQELEFQLEKVISLNLQIKENEVVFNQLRKINIQLNEDLDRQKAQIENYKFEINSLAQKQRRIQLQLVATQEARDNFQRKTQQFSLLLQVTQEKFNKQMQQMRETLEANTANMLAVQTQFETLSDQHSKLKKEHLQLTVENEQMHNKIKDQRFQAQNVAMKYNQSLLHLQSQKIFYKQISIQVSTFKRQIEQLTRELQVKELLLKEAKEKHQHEADFLKLQMANQNKLIELRRQFIHPLIYEDLLSQSAKNCQNMQNLKKQFIELTGSLEGGHKDLVYKQKQLIQELRSTKHNLQLLQHAKTTLEKQLESKQPGSSPEFKLLQSQKLKLSTRVNELIIQRAELESALKQVNTEKKICEFNEANLTKEISALKKQLASMQLSLIKPPPAETPAQSRPADQHEAMISQLWQQNSKLQTIIQQLQEEMDLILAQNKKLINSDERIQTKNDLVISPKQSFHQEKVEKKPVPEQKPGEVSAATGEAQESQRERQRKSMKQRLSNAFKYYQGKRK